MKYKKIVSLCKEEKTVYPAQNIRRASVYRCVPRLNAARCADSAESIGSRYVIRGGVDDCQNRPA